MIVSHYLWDWKTSTTINCGCYTLKHIPFGLSEAPDTFQSATAVILRAVLVCLVHDYLDGNIITSSSSKEYIAYLGHVFNVA